LLEALDSALKVFSPQLRAIALLDKDYSEASSDPRVILLPVSMIENFLLDPDSIWEAIQSVVERSGLSTVDDVEQALNAVLDELESQEVERRVIQQLGIAYFRPHIPISEVPQQATNFANELVARFAVANISYLRDTMTKQVENLKSTARRREEYHGKAALDAFYKHHLQNTGLQKGIFRFEAARYARWRKSVINYFDGLFTSLEQSRAG
jgi:hypothetical protein